MMADHRDFLVNALRRVVEGGDIDLDELNAAIVTTEAQKLTGAELDAYIRLAQWADDADIRAKEPDTRYAESKRDWLRRTLTELKATQT